VNASGGRLTSEARGEVVEENGVLRIRRIEVVYHLKASEDQRPAIERAHEFHADHCPLARTLAGCVEIATRLEIEAP
jgi:uncharacterized OsmC-like protein